MACNKFHEPLTRSFIRDISSWEDGCRRT